VDVGQTSQNHLDLRSRRMYGGFSTLRRQHSAATEAGADIVSK
jgi:hypothetical protein